MHVNSLEAYCLAESPRVLVNKHGLEILLGEYCSIVFGFEF